MLLMCVWIKLQTNHVMVNMMIDDAAFKNSLIKIQS